MKEQPSKQKSWNRIAGASSALKNRFALFHMRYISVGYMPGSFFVFFMLFCILFLLHVLFFPLNFYFILCDFQLFPFYRPLKGM